MPLDAVCLTAVLEEIRPQILGTRVDKIQQPEKDQILLTLRGREGGGKLLLAAGTGRARIHLTARSYENPQHPPMFCMLLRKHLSGAKLAEIHQPPMERIVRLEFDTFDAMGEPSRKTLILELLGKYCNLIFIDQEGIIQDAIRRVDGDLSRTRTILPGLFYRLAENQGKRNPLETERAALAAYLAAGGPDIRLDKWLLDTFFGLSPLICRELVDRVFGQTDIRLSDASPDQMEAFLDGVMAFFDQIRAGAFTPYQLSEGNVPFEFTYTPIHQYRDQLTLTKAADFSALLDGFYEQRDRESTLRQRAGALMKTVTNLRDRTARKLALQEEERNAAEDRERFREQGDIITANLHAMLRGQEALTAQNFYDPDGGEITIPLDPLKTPQQNAAAYYKKYNKAKTAERHLTEQMEKGAQELDYLNSVLDALEKAETAGDMAEIRQELADAKLIRDGGGKRQKPPPAKPLVFRSSGGFDLYVGKNNVQNDRLTFKTANRSDLWFHTQKIHGSHVIVACDGQEPDAQTIEEAAMLAAWYSQGRSGGKVPVDYTLVKHVKKPAGGKPGAAHYVNHKTIYVTPDETIVQKLQ